MATKDPSLRMPISLKGIDRRANDFLPDGSLLELINLRYHNESLRPVPAKVRLSLPSLTWMQILYIHVISEAVSVYWGINTVEDPYEHSYLGYSVCVDGTFTYSDSTFISYSGPPVPELLFSSIGNALLLSNLLAETTLVLLYQPDTAIYKIFDPILAEMPLVEIASIVKSDDDENLITSVSGDYEEIDLAVTARAVDQIERLSKKGYLIGKYLVRCAWELFDGSIVSHNVPVEVSLSVLDAKNSTTHVHNGFVGYAIQYRLGISSADIAAIKTKYKGIINSFNFYATNNPELLRLDWSLKTVDVYYSLVIPESDYIGTTVTKIKETIFYFSLTKVPLADLLGDTWVTLTLDDVSDLSSGVVMTAGNFSHHYLFGKSLFAYNQRVFMGNIKNTLFGGFRLRGFLYPGSTNIFGELYSIGLSFDIETAGGTKRVFTGWQDIDYYKPNASPVDTCTDSNIFSSTTIGDSDRAWTPDALIGMTVTITGGTGVGQSRLITDNTSTYLTVATWTITPDGTSDFKVESPEYWQFTMRRYSYFGYPDPRAKSCTMWHKELGGTIRRLRTFDLIQVYGMGFSFAIPAVIFPVLDAGWPKVNQSLCDWIADTLTINSTYWDSDRIQATEFNNPFYFPTKNSYRVDGFVLGMAINVMALSPGQFGQFPIFAFTSQGIWVLTIGDGEILITTVKPLSGTVCISSKSILGIDGGVIFLSNEGLMILSGTKSESFSDMLIGTPDSPLEGMLDYEKIINDPNTYQPVQFMDLVSFETYMIDADIAFMIVASAQGPQKEIIVSNPAYTYSYVFNLGSKTWHKISQVWNRFIHSFPKTYGTKFVTISDNFLDDLTLEVTDVDKENPILVHLETRPLKFGEEVSFKKIIRTLLYGWIHPGNESPFTFFLFGSVDGRHWFVQQASNVLIAENRVAIGRSLFSCRNFIIVIGGNIFDDSFIQALICDIEKRYNQKLQ